MKTATLPSWRNRFSGRLAGALPAESYVLPVPADARRAIAARWLMLGLAALAASGIFSLLLVFARAPGLARIFPVSQYFYPALVVHVDLSVLVWFASFAAVLWSLNSTARFHGLVNAAQLLCVAGVALMCAAPFAGNGSPIMSNYVPVLNDALFLWGLGIFGSGFAALTLWALLTPSRVGLPLEGAGALRFGLNASAVSAAVALGALAWTWAAMPQEALGRTYYEVLFLGAGHVIQFTWTLLMLVAWLWLATLSGARLPLTPRLAVLLFAVGLVSVFLVPAIYLAWEVGSPEHSRMLTWLMRFGGGLAIGPLALAVLVGLARARPAAPESKPLRAALVASMVLFSIGGSFGFLIQGSDVRIPAHYHGSIVGVTLALMGLTYALLPALGYAKPRRRWATVQPWLYGLGQLLHIVGLVWSGGYGVQRKVADGTEAARSFAETAGMGLMGAGGLIAIAGGLLFLVVVADAMRARALQGARGPRSGARQSV